MRRHHYKLILDIVHTIDEALGEAQRLITKGNPLTALSLLADCQAGAVRIGDFVESLVGEDTKTVTFLEKFCDLLYEESLSIEHEQINSMKKLKKKLLEIQNCIENELSPNKIEIAFFPYKSSMWDSMESLWKAAEEDDYCEAYVIPIPYYDLNPDGSLGSMHYEGRQYRYSLPVVDWEKYKIEEHHPDVVIIHNPYDNQNRVTTIHPDYYSWLLKAHTDLLCYIPYFVSPENLQEHFCTTSGVQHADKVFVQSEENRRVYINALRAMEKKHSRVGIFGNLEEKIIASGSPKFDKIIHAKPEDFSLPETWRRLMEKTDGSKKKVVLYCTSLGALLQGGNAYLKKLRFMLNAFGSRDDLILWWRPHPLQEATYTSMLPQLMSEYQSIIAEYCKKGFGIYDDTPDLHRALCYGSFYYGDWSSLVLLFGVTGKRIMLQETALIGTQSCLRFGSVAFDERGTAWGWDLFFNGLFCLDFKDNKAHLAGMDDSLPGTATYSHIQIDVHQGSVISFPFYANSIVKYNNGTKTYQVILLNPSYRNQKFGVGGFHITHWVKHGDTYYCFGRSAGALVVYHCMTNEIEYHTGLFQKFNLCVGDGTRTKCPIYIGKPSHEGWVQMLLEGNGALIHYCLPTQESVVLAVEPRINECTHADFDGEKFWLVSEKKEGIFSWNPRNGEFEIYTDLPAKFIWSKTPDSVLRPVDCGSYVLFFPGFENMILRLEKSTGAITEYTEMPVPDDPDGSVYKYQLPKRIGDRIYAFARFNQTIYELEPVSGEITERSFRLEDEDHQSYLEISAYYPEGFKPEKWEECIMNDNILADQLFEKLADSTERVEAQKNKFLNLTASTDGKAGETILREIKKQMQLQ